MTKHRLRRFAEAQAPVYGDALSDLQQGRLCAPYMDFIFPRLEDGDHDGTSRLYAIASLDEAGAYLADAVLGSRYRECAGALLWFPDRPAHEMFGEATSRKLHASLTLFTAAANSEPLLRVMLDIWFDRRLDEQTMRRLGRT